MPKLPRLSGREICAVLKAHGYAANRLRGSHVVMRKGSGVCVVPDHKEVKKGTLAGILRQAEITPGVFAAWVKRR